MAIFDLCPREESNLNYKIRNLASYPLNDEGYEKKFSIYNRTIFNEDRKLLQAAQFINCPVSTLLETDDLFKRIDERWFVGNFAEERLEIFSDLIERRFWGDHHDRRSEL